jgi:hypothetical protein
MQSIVRVALCGYCSQWTLRIYLTTGSVAGLHTRILLTGKRLNLFSIRYIVLSFVSLFLAIERYKRLFLMWERVDDVPVPIFVTVSWLTTGRIVANNCIVAMPL